MKDILMKTETKENQEWKQFISDGDKYLKTALNGTRRKEVFTNDLLYNIVSMAIEKHFMGLLLFHNKMPDNHTLIDLIRSIKEITEIESDLEKNIEYMDDFQNICAIDTYEIKIPNEKEVEIFLATGKKVQEFVKDKVGNLMCET